jgi:hypothetical protein
MSPPKTIAELRDLAIKQLTAPGVHDPNDRAHLLARGVLGLLGDLKAIEASNVEPTTEGA